MTNPLPENGLGWLNVASHEWSVQETPVPAALEGGGRAGPAGVLWEV